MGNYAFAAVALFLLLLGCPGAGGGGQPVERVVEAGDGITVDYVGTFDDGAVFDSSLTEGREPLTFIVGRGEVIPGFDKAVLGMKEGEVKEVRIPPAEAYGEWSAENVVDVPRVNVHGDIEVGSQLTGDNGMAGTVVEITSENVKLDFNHPLAGEALNFRIIVNGIVKSASM